MVTINVGPDRPEIKPSTRPSHKVRKTQNCFVLRLVGIEAQVELPGQNVLDTATGCPERHGASAQLPPWDRGTSRPLQVLKYRLLVRFPCLPHG